MSEVAVPYRAGPHRRRARTAAVALAVVAAWAGGAVPGRAEGAVPPDRIQRVEYFPGPGAVPRQVTVPADAPAAGAAGRVPGPGPSGPAVRPLQRTGPVSGRLDLVVMGDGYTADEQDEFAADAEEKLDAIFRIEPYRSYRGLFDIWLVDAVSPESGVSGDPTADVVRRTALGSSFFCDGVERLLCVDTGAVTRYAALAPDADIVFVVAHSAKYGGAGYSAPDLPPGSPFHGVATMSSGNDRSYLIGAHELGHSIGGLADEYQYPGYGAYPWTEEPAAANLTLHRDPAEAKWARWAGVQDPTGSVVGTYEGGGYYETGVHRPTDTSLMRTLASTEFNVVGREAMIAGFYADADALTSAVPTAEPVRATRPLTVRLAPLTGLADLRLTWSVDGRPVPWAAGLRSVTPRALGVRGHGHRVTAAVTDRTAALRDPALRARAADSLTWTVR
ncbi:M64 family metallopeptidase [Streptomyces cinerochromogenes]|uniref:M64 family metallopeptidase n=1 Tax=Streptomyces cinerochromogenes TaxID=66422 RepID=UPI001E3248DD|nr:M64 family metallopeptidase [Streptomyces cinerochromogenes]